MSTASTPFVALLVVACVATFSSPALTQQVTLTPERAAAIQQPFISALPAMVRWPGLVPPHTEINDTFSAEDWATTSDSTS
jgi:hypothetical protein